jgi:iron complex outermembrane receptor protein
LAFLFACTLKLPGAEAQAGTPPPDLTELPIEALMEMEVPKVYGVSKVEQKTTEAPSSVTVITAEEIKRYGYRTLADVLQSVQGFYVSYDRNYAFLGARGVNLGDFNARILVLIDGHRINNNLTDGAYLDSAFLLDVDLIERVEIIRGPGSVVYGNNAFFGVINVITRQGQHVDGAEVSGEYGSFDAYKGRATYGRQFTNGFGLLLSGSYYDSHGDDRLYYPEFDQRSSSDPRATNNGVAEDLDDDSFGSFFGSLSYRDFALQGGYIRRDKGNPTAQYLTTFNDPGLSTTDERSYAALKYEHSFTDVVEVTARAYYDSSVFEIGYPFGGTVFEEKDIGEWWGAELQVSKRLWEHHLFSVGAEYRDDFNQERRLSGQPTYREDRQSHGFYAQANIAVVTNLHLDAGIRYDQYGDFDPAFNPRVALIYNPAEKSTLKAIYGTAFRAPNFLELSLSSPGQLDPETITSYELVYEQGIGQNLRSSLAGFYNQMHDLIVFDSGSFTNFDADTGGLEVALAGVWANGIRSRVSYSFQVTDNNPVSWDMPDSPAHLVKLNVSVPVVRDKVFAGLEYQFTSRRYSLHNTVAGGQPVTVQGETADAFGVLNFTVFSRDLVKNLEFSASVYNLLDQEYADPATRFHLQDTLERDGRTFRIKLTYRF